jgi:hypothetical protein
MPCKGFKEAIGGKDEMVKKSVLNAVLNGQVGFRVGDDDSNCIGRELRNGGAGIKRTPH